MAPRASIVLLLPALTCALRKRRSVGLKEAALTDAPEVFFDYEDSWGTFREDVTAENVSAQWSPCAFGMCWSSWGAYRQSHIPGVGGIGNNGCRFWPFSCPGSSKPMDCALGPCPKHFGSPACVSVSSCRSYCDLAHAGTCRYTGPRSQEPWHSTWMSEFPNSPLNKLLMIEAHHYLAILGTLDFYNPVESSNEILSQLAPFKDLPGMGDLMRVAYASLLPMFSSCGSADTATLLRSGVRAFDIRPYLSSTDNVIRDSHGGRGPSVDDALRQVADFVRSHRSEIVFVSFKNILHGTGSCLDCKSAEETYQSINAAVQRHFGDCGGGTLICDLDATKTVGELVQQGNVIVHSSNGGLVGGSGNRIHSASGLYAAPWYNKNDLGELKSAVLADSGLQQLSRDSNTTLISHQFILTPKADDFIGAISSRFTGNWQDRANRHGCQSLACLAEVASGTEFQSFYGQIRERYARSNFLMLDFADRPGAMDFIRWANQNYAH